MDQDNPLKSDLEHNITYLLCPDKTCKLFYDASQRIPCENRCPKQDDLIKIIKCSVCNNIIELPGDHSPVFRIDHKEPEGCGGENFRLDGKYCLIFKRPK